MPCTQDWDSNRDQYRILAADPGRGATHRAWLPHGSPRRLPKGGIPTDDRHLAAIAARQTNLPADCCEAHAYPPLNRGPFL